MCSVIAQSLENLADRLIADTSGRLLDLKQISSALSHGNDIRPSITALRCQNGTKTLFLPERGDERLEVESLHGVRVFYGHRSRNRTSSGMLPIQAVKNLGDGHFRLFAREKSFSSEVFFPSQSLIENLVEGTVSLPCRQRVIDVDVFFLTNPVGPVGRLSFLGGVPVPRVVDDVVGPRQC